VHNDMHDAINISLCRKIVKYDIRSYNRTIHHKIGKFTLKLEALADLQTKGRKGKVSAGI